MDACILKQGLGYKGSYSALGYGEVTCGIEVILLLLKKKSFKINRRLLKQITSAPLDVSF